MTKSQLVEALARKQTQLELRDIDACVDIILEAISAALVRDDRAEIRGFGSFTLRHHPPRVGRNPKTGETVQIEPTRAPHFKPGKELRDRVNELFAGSAPSDQTDRALPSSP